MTSISPIIPPPELVQQWIQQASTSECTASQVATQAAQWGYQQAVEELEACCEWLAKPEVALTGKGPSDLRSARRPKPPSLRLQALNDLNTAYNEDAIDDTTYCNIRRALEQLDD